MENLSRTYIPIRVLKPQGTCELRFVVRNLSTLRRELSLNGEENEDATYVSVYIACKINEYQGEGVYKSDTQSSPRVERSIHLLLSNCQ